MEARSSRVHPRSADQPRDRQTIRVVHAQVEFLRRALTLTSDGRLPYPEIIFSAPKKSGKTATAAMIAIYAAVVISGPYGEVYCLANDYEQAASRVFQAAARMVEASPLLRHGAKVTADKIIFKSTGTFIQACASDYTGFAGSNPSLTICDELWGFVHEASRRLFDEAIPSPTRNESAAVCRNLCRLRRRKRVARIALQARAGGPGSSPRSSRRRRHLDVLDPSGQGSVAHSSVARCVPREFETESVLRMIENGWVSTESSFIDMAWWDECVIPSLRPVVSDRDLYVWVGVDASVKRDSTAIVVCGFDEDTKQVILVAHRVFQPSKEEPLNFEATIEASLLEIERCYTVREIRFDPYQMQAPRNASQLRA